MLQNAGNTGHPTCCAISNKYRYWPPLLRWIIVGSLDNMVFRDFRFLFNCSMSRESYQVQPFGR